MRVKEKPNLRKYSLLLILLGMIGISHLLSENFLTSSNLLIVLRQVSIVAICAFAQGMIIILGGIDLSIGYLAGMAGSFAVIMYLASGNLVFAFAFGVLLGATVGAINGLFIAYFKLPPFIVTLAMQAVCFGAILLYTQGQNIFQIGTFRYLGQGYVFGVIPTTVFFMLIMLGITFFILKFTKFGRYMYAIGGNTEAAIAAGIQVVKVKWMAYILSGMYAAVAGMVMMGRLNAGIASEGGGLETDAITATVIGGTSFSGGAGTAFGTFFGAIIIGILDNIMTLMGVDSYIRMIVKGAIIILAVLADSLTRSQRRKVKIMASSSDAKAEKK